MGIWIVVGIIVLLVLAYIGMYNSLVSLRNQVKNAWAQIDVQLERRHDLIPNLIETVKGYVKHERDTLENITKARTNAMAASGAAAAGRAEGELSGAISRLMLVVENYPDLKANQNFLALQEELSSTENKVSFSRQFYNDAVMSYNTKRETFPTNLIAGPFNFAPAELFVIEKPEEKEAPKVSF